MSMCVPHGLCCLFPCLKSRALVLQPSTLTTPSNFRLVSSGSVGSVYRQVGLTDTSFVCDSVVLITSPLSSLCVMISYCLTISLANVAAFTATLRPVFVVHLTRTQLPDPVCQSGSSSGVECL